MKMLLTADVHIGRTPSRLPAGEGRNTSCADAWRALVELAVDEPLSLLPQIHNAGAIFLGHHTPEAIGDYVGGSNHVLPTARSARFASGLGVLDFMKRTSVLGCDPSSLAALAPAARTLAEVEGLDAHGRSVSIRLNR